MTSAVLPKQSVEPAIEAPTGPKPLTEGKQPLGILIGLWAFVVIPFIALVAAIPIAWRYGSLTWTIVAIGAVFYTVSGLGITVGFHRYFTHGSFKAKRGLRIALAIAGSMAIQGEPTQWVADHRRHHTFSDLEGDPHSPWRFGTSFGALIKGLWYAHMGWLFHRELSNRARFAPDLLADRDMQRVDNLFPLIVAASMLAPAAAGGLITMSWSGRPVGVLLGRPGPGLAAAPRDLVDQLDLPRRRRAPVRAAQGRQGRELLAARDPVVRRELAQPAPRRPDLCTPRRRQGPDRHLRSYHLGFRKARLGARRALAAGGALGREAGSRHGMMGQ